MTDYGFLAGAAVLIFLITLSVFVVRALRSEHAEKDWMRASATVLESRPWQGSRADAPHGSYLVRATLTTADGRVVSAWAEGAYTEADRWVGRTRPAWHHPAQIDGLPAGRGVDVRGEGLWRVPAGRSRDVVGRSPQPEGQARNRRVELTVLS